MSVRQVGGDASSTSGLSWPEIPWLSATYTGVLLALWVVAVAPSLETWLAARLPRGFGRLARLPLVARSLQLPPSELVADASYRAAPTARVDLATLLEAGGVARERIWVSADGTVVQLTHAHALRLSAGRLSYGRLWMQTESLFRIEARMTGSTLALATTGYPLGALTSLLSLAALSAACLALGSLWPLLPCVAAVIVLGVGYLSLRQAGERLLLDLLGEVERALHGPRERIEVGAPPESADAEPDSATTLEPAAPKARELHV